MADDKFYENLAPDADFAALTRPERFRPVPDDWAVAATDIVDSTAQIAAGRYKLVNTVGASAIAAMRNALPGQTFPYVFGGDGASFAVPGSQIAIVQHTLAVLRRWVGAEFGLTLRAALVPVADIRAAGRDVRVARYAASTGVDYAMFAGGGLAWAERQMKRGAFSVEPATDDAQPDLTGLSCRWNSIPARNGMILSLVAVPGADAAGFAELATRIVTLAEGLGRGGHPVPAEGPEMQLLPPGLEIEAHVSRSRRPLWLRRLQLRAQTLIAWFLFRTGLKVRGFDPVHYRAAISSNADFRKFDDGLKMTLDCDPATRDRLVALLETAEKAGKVSYGLHEQTDAMVTCVVPSVLREDHMHFVDGAAGGYTAAAARIKQTSLDAAAG